MPGNINIIYNLPVRSTGFYSVKSSGPSSSKASLVFETELEGVSDIPRHSTLYNEGKTLL